MADAWLGISSAELDSYCGDEGGSANLSNALDGSNFWYHDQDEAHWFIIDLGATYTIKKVKGRSNSSQDPLDVDIYVSDSKTVWGAAVASGINTWQDTEVEQEVDTTDKDGRYIKVVINDTEDATRKLRFGKTSSPYMTIFDAYGSLAGVEHALAGVIAGVASVSGAIVRTLLVAGASTGVASVSGAIALTLKLAGASSGVCSASAALINQKWLAGIATGRAVVIGILTNQKWLAGVAAGKAVVSATLTNIKWLAGVIAGVATASANLFHVRVAIRVLSAVRNLLALRNIPPVR